MPVSLAPALQALSLDSWISAVLLLGALTLVGLNCFSPHQTSRGRGNYPTEAEGDREGGLEAEAKSRAHRPGRRDHEAATRSHHCPSASPTQTRSPGSTIEKTMRVVSSIVILLAAIYIIIFDQEANTDRQKWAFGAVGLVFGHWAKR